KVASVKAILEPDRSTKESFGASLFRAMIQALGDETGIRESLSVQAEGSLTTWARDGQSTRWTFLMRNKPDRALLQVKGSGGAFFEAAFSGSQFKTSKALKSDASRDLPADFGLVRDRQLSSLIALLSTPKFKMVSSSIRNAAGQDLTLIAEGSTETISISLDND